jgi:para-aminobenzoate synthetase component 1
MTSTSDRRFSPVVEPLHPVPDPAQCCEQLAGLPCRIFLDSAAGGPLGRYSFLMADPVALVRSKGPRLEYVDRLLGSTQVLEADALSFASQLIGPFAAATIPNLPPFQGGLAGYIAYNWGQTLERLPAARYDDVAVPDVTLCLYDWVLAWDHEQGAAWLISTGLPETSSSRHVRAAERAANVRSLLQQGYRQAGESIDVVPRMGLSGRGGAPSYPVANDLLISGASLRSSFPHDGYVEAVSRVREYILAGDIFQSNLSQRFEAPLAESPWSFYRRLRARNSAPFAAFLDLPDAVVLSASPERFLRSDSQGRVETRPIKGTRPRGLGPEHDAALGVALVESEKDRAENLMIVDLMRNDLSRVCLPGSVRVSELYTLERYATVHHLVSAVVGQLAPDKTPFDLLRVAFPGGSITGAPKLRAMEIIAELEPSERGVYCGTIGYFSVTGELDTNIAIRTAVAHAGRIYFNAGGGIVADSDPEQEYRETLDKARGIINALVSG